MCVAGGAGEVDLLTVCELALGTLRKALCIVQRFSQRVSRKMSRRRVSGIFAEALFRVAIHVAILSSVHLYRNM